MNFPNQSRKTTQAVARLIERSGGPVDYLRISKLIYLADRESILKRGIPIVGGKYFSMKRGPTISEVMDFVNSRNAPQWKTTISSRHANELRLERMPEYGALSRSELSILDEVVKKHLMRTTEELVELCHLHCPEYCEVKSGRKAIEVESILRAGKKTKEQVKRVIDDAKEIEELNALLA